MKKLMIGLPSGDGWISVPTVTAVLNAINSGKCHNVQMHVSSILPRAFNVLLCNALNNGFDYFLMLHADIELEPKWLSRLLEIKDKTQADILSVVSPLKSPQGFTSTAIDTQVGDLDTRYRVKRLTMVEIDKKGGTWTEQGLLVNTAVFLLDLGWFKSLAKPLWFDFDEAIKQVGKTYVPMGMSEDWLFSRQAQKQGAKIYATNEIKLCHIGPYQYKNWGAWGSEESDTE